MQVSHSTTLVLVAKYHLKHYHMLYQKDRSVNSTRLKRATDCRCYYYYYRTALSNVLMDFMLNNFQDLLLPVQGKLTVEGTPVI